MTDDEKQAYIENSNAIYEAMIPHVRVLGIRLVDLGEDFVTLRLPYSERLVGNPETGVLHGGVVTTLVDTACGAAVVTRLMDMRPVATLDLRLDYLRPAKPERALFARAECYRVTKQVAFVRAVAYEDEPENPVASASGTFIIQEA